MRFPTYLQKLASGLISGFVIIAILLVSYGPLKDTPRAHAILGAGDTVFVIGGIGDIPANISASADVVSSAMEYAVKYKEFVLDPIVWQLINVTINQMSRSIVTWINSGFAGSPAFVTNLGGFLTDIADQVVGDFISGSELGFVCSPFKFELKAALALQYNKARDFRSASQCTLSGVVNNVDAFMNGNFLAGGWDGWFEMTQNPVNNPYGMMVLAQNELQFKIGSTKLMEGKLLDWGKGFFTVKQVVDDESGGHTINVTPGTAIEDTLNNSLDSGNRRLQIADEFNEILGALMSQIATQALSGVGGLLGMTNSSAGSYGGAPFSNYFDQIDADRSASTFMTSGASTIEDSILNEEKYLVLQQKIVALIKNAENYATTYYAGCGYPSGLPENLQNALTKAEKEVVTTTGTISSLNDILDDYLDIIDPSTPLATQNAIMSFYGANNLAEAEYKIMNTFSTFYSSGALHSPPDLVTVELIDTSNVEKMIQDYQTAIYNACYVIVGGDA